MTGVLPFLGYGKSYGHNDSTMRGAVACAMGSAPHVKSGWAQLVASTEFNAEGMVLTFACTLAGDFMVDLGIGTAGNECAIVENLYIAAQRTPGSHLQSVYLPIRIRKGVRVVARAQGTATSANNLYVSIQLFHGGRDFLPGCSRIITLGADTVTTRGVSIDPGSVAHTFGAWAELATSLSRNLCGFLILFGTDGSGSKSTARVIMQLGIGLGGAERVLVPALTTQLIHNSADRLADPAPFIWPMEIRKGQRIVMRGQTSISTTTPSERTIDAILYGLVP